MAGTIAPDVDRLPWLKDEIRPRARPSRFVAPFLAASTVALIAASSYWLGFSGVFNTDRTVPIEPEASVALPPPSLPEIHPAPVMPEVKPTPAPTTVALPAQKDVRVEVPSGGLKAPAAKMHRTTAKPVRTKAKATPASKGLEYTNPWESKGASGRMVRVGAYGSLEQGKQAWSRLAKLSPAIRQLPAVVTDLPSRNGKVYYWLQIGTTSQAHSEVLCQRMRAIRQSCVVVDVAGARKGSGNERQPVSTLR